MDAKAKANFINSVAKDNNIPCQSCGGLNNAGAKFCKFCGTKLAQPQPTPIPDPQPVPGPQPMPVPEPQPTPAPDPQPMPVPDPQPVPTPQPVAEGDMPFKSIDKSQPVSKPQPVHQPEQKAEPVGSFYYEEPVSVFAQGLPEWSVEPPQVMVRRKRKK